MRNEGGNLSMRKRQFVEYWVDNAVTSRHYGSGTMTRYERLKDAKEHYEKIPEGRAKRIRRITWDESSYYVDPYTVVMEVKV